MLNAIRMDIERYRRAPSERAAVILMRALYSHPAFLGVLWYRLSHQAWQQRNQPLQRLWYGLLRLLYPFVRIVSGLELPPSATVGPGLWVGHLGPTVIHPRTQIGAGATLLHQVTIGEGKDGVPVLGDNVSIGVGATLVGGDSRGKWCHDWRGRGCDI